MNINATIFGQSISFIFFVLFCMKFIWPAIMKVIQKRQEEVFNSIVSIKKAKKKLQKINSKSVLEINIAKKKCSKIIQDAFKKKELIIYNAKKKAFAEQKKIIKKTKLEISIAKMKAKNDIKDNAILLAVQIAEKLLQEKINKNYINKSIKKFMVDFRGI